MFGPSRLRLRALRPRSLGPFLIAGALVVPGAAYADDPPLAVALEPAVAIPLSKPQSTIYDVGGGETVKLLVGVTPWLDIGPAVSFLLLPSATPGGESGMAWGFGGGARLQRPRDAGLSPWLAVDALYVRSDELNRPAFAAAVGLAVPIDDRHRFWIGPFVRYMQTIQPAREGFDNTDAKILLVGVSLEAGSARRPARAAEIVETRVGDAPEPAEPVAAACPDRDHDGIADNIDRCPDVVGAIEDAGCPAYHKIVVHKDKLELKEKLYFAYDHATLEPASFPILDEVAQALADNPNFRVQVEGHTDSSGADGHNQTLSEQRATTVVDYLVAHGVAKDRLVSKGFSSSVPTDTNDTVAGRENNRRVEFVVSFVILNKDGTK